MIFKGSRKKRKRAESDFAKEIYDLATAKGYATKKVTMELTRKFTFAGHALERFSELGIKMPLDCGNLVLVKGSDFYSNRFKTKIKKYSRTRNRTNSYWTDGSFVYVCRSRKAGNFTIVTVL